jgi:hypothetical protein
VIAVHNLLLFTLDLTLWFTLHSALGREEMKGRYTISSDLIFVAMNEMVFHLPTLAQFLAKTSHISQSNASTLGPHASLLE